MFHGVARDRHRVTYAVAGLGREHVDPSPGRHELELRDRVRTLQVGGDQQGGVPLGRKPATEFAGKRRLARALQAGEEDDSGGRLGEPQGSRATTQNGDQFFIYDLDYLLGRVQRSRDLRSHCPFAHGRDEGTDRRQRDVGLQQRHPDLPGGGIDVSLGQPPLAAKRRESLVETAGQGVEHAHTPRSLANRSSQGTHQDGAAAGESAACGPSPLRQVARRGTPTR